MAAVPLGPPGGAALRLESKSRCSGSVALSIEWRRCGTNSDSSGLPANHIAQ